MLHRPVSRKHLAELLVLRIISILALEPSQGFNQLRGSHPHDARDHTRGLLEVRTSIVPSTPHALHDVALFVRHGHGSPPSSWIPSILEPFGPGVTRPRNVHGPPSVPPGRIPMRKRRMQS